MDTQRLLGLMLGQSEHALISHGLHARVVLTCNLLVCGQRCASLILRCLLLQHGEHPYAVRSQKEEVTQRSMAEDTSH